MTDKELMQQALDALINAKGYIFHNVLDDKANQYDTAVEALRARLAQPEPEPVAWFMEGTFEDGAPSFTQVCETDPEFYVPLYTAPPQREWQGLTDEEKLIVNQMWNMVGVDGSIKAIETRLKEKNSA